MYKAAHGALLLPRCHTRIGETDKALSSNQSIQTGHVTSSSSPVKSDNVEAGSWRFSSGSAGDTELNLR
jgi:hypothetical protein